MLFWIAAALCVGAIWLRFFAGYEPAPAGIRALGAHEYATVRAVGLVTFPPGGAVEPGADEAGVPAYVDRYVAAQPPAQRTLMRLLFFLVEHATVFFPPAGPAGMRRFTRLDASRQAQYLDGWGRSRLFPRRLVFSSLRAIVTMGFLADPGVRSRLELEPIAVTRAPSPADDLWPPLDGAGLS